MLSLGGCRTNHEKKTNHIGMQEFEPGRDFPWKTEVSRRPFDGRREYEINKALTQAGTLPAPMLMQLWLNTPSPYTSS